MAASRPRASFRQRFGVPLAATIPGIVALALYVFLTTDPASTPHGLPVSVLAAASIVNPLILVVIACLLGAYTAPRVGLRSYLIDRVATGDRVWPRLEPELGVAIGLGIVGSLAIIVIDTALAPFLARDLPISITTQTPTLGAVLAYIPVRFLYGGIVEEVMLRFGLMSAIAYAGWYLSGRPGMGPSSTVMWVAIVVAAILFGAGHLPALGGVAPLTPLLVARTIFLNAIGGVVFGWLYWRYSLEAAMISHMTFHVPLTILSVVQIAFL